MAGFEPATTRVSSEVTLVLHHRPIRAQPLRIKAHVSWSSVARLKARPDTNLHFCTTLCRSANHVSQTTFDICETHSPGAARKVRGRSFQLPCASGLRPRRWNSAPRQGSPPCLVVRCEVTLLFHHRRLSRWQTGETPVSPSNRYETHIRVSIGWLSPRRPAPFIVSRARAPAHSFNFRPGNRQSRQGLHPHEDSNLTIR